jgi:hypothetical protein
MLRLESGEQLPFILDTGSPWTLFDKSLEPKLGKRLHTGTTWNFGVKQDSDRYATPKLYLGSTLLMTSRTNIATCDCQQLSTDAGRRIMGILGMDFLEHYCIQLDFAAHKMHFLDDAHADKKGWGKLFPLAHLGDECFFLNENLAGAKDSGSLIDTGCSYDGWLTPQLYQQWTNRATAYAIMEVRSSNGQMGGETYPDMALLWVDPKVALSGDWHFKRNGIGLNFLARHLVTFDFHNWTMYLKRTSVGPLVDQDLEAEATAAAKAAATVLKALRSQGQLPGWSKGDEAPTKDLPFNFRYPDSGICDLVKTGDSSVYHYLFTRVSETGPWKLQKAWRTDQNDHLVEEYPVR